MWHAVPLKPTGATVPRIADFVHCEGDVAGFTALGALQWITGDTPCDTHATLWVVAAEQWQLSLKDENNRAVVGADVTLEPHWEIPSLVAYPDRRVLGELPDPIHAVTDNAGQVHLSVGLGLDYRIRVMHPEHLDYSALVVASARLPVITLDRGATASATIVDTTGMALADVVVRPLDPRHNVVRTDSTGCFRFSGIDPEAGLVTWLSKPGFVAREFRLACNAAQFATKIVLSTGLTFSGFVVDANARPAAGAALRLSPVKDQPGGTWRPIVEATADDAGQFVATDLAAGCYRFEVRAPGSDRFEFVEEVQAGWQGFAVCIAGPTSAILRGSVVSATTKTPLERFTVTVLRRSDTEAMLGETFDVCDRTGQFATTGLEPCKVLVRVQVAGHDPVEIATELRAGGNDVAVEIPDA